MIKAMAEMFPSINPIRLRYEKAKDVIRFENQMLKNVSKHLKSNNKTTKGVNRVPAGDRWF